MRAHDGPAPGDGPISDLEDATRVLGREDSLAAQLDELWAMSRHERVAAMRAGELSLTQLAAWTRRRPHELPTIGGEFEWIVVSTVDYLEASQKRSRVPPCDACSAALDRCRCAHGHGLLIAALEQLDRRRAR